MHKAFFILSFISCFVTYAQNNIVAPATIESARVYTNGAELKHKTTVQIPMGASEIIITNVADDLNENTINVKAPKHVTLMSAQFSNAYIKETSDLNSSQQKAVRDEINAKQKELEKTRFMITTEEKGIELLDSNRTISGSQTFTVNEIKQWFTYYKSSRLDALAKINDLKVTEKKLVEDIKQLNGRLQLDQVQNNNYSQGKLILSITSTKAAVIPLEISYLTYEASWTPNYELNIEKVNQPIQFFYQAQLSQDTGVDWKNVNLSLVSTPANQSTQAPKLNTWFINYDDSKYTVPTYSKRSKPMASIKMEEESVLEEVVVVGYAANTVNQSQLSVTYDISIPYTILSNGKNHVIKLDEKNIAANYEFITIPKLDTNAYLVAKISDYGNYNILPGPATLILEDLFVGETYLNPDADNNQLTLSVGKDPNILVSRKKINEKSQTKILSSKKIQDFNYEIAVRNNKKEAIKIIVEDNYPISTNADIEVALTDKDGATVDTETGKLTWYISLKPNETKKIKFGYQIKYAKDKNIQL
jgi:uncharacterized protein (TIGR02231 family)